jgi:hypothetical protein
MKAFRPGSLTNVPLRKAADQEPLGSQLPIDVRSVRLRDLIPLSSIRQRYPLDLPGGACIEADPAMVGLKQMMPLMRHDHPMLVARSDRGLVGYAYFAVVGPDQRWMLQGVGSQMGIFARLPVGTSVLAAARKVGFAPYVSESIWAAALVPVTRPGHRVRRQQQSDVWSIHQLYMTAVPRQVQYAEALTSHNWDLDAQHLPGGMSCMGWLVDSGHLVGAYARVIEFLVDPEHRAVFGDLVSTVFAELGRMPARRVYVTVRGYQAELAEILQGFGLVLHLEQDVHIKYTTASAWAPSVTVSPFSADVKEPSAKRVPTFLHGSHSDPTSETVGS